MSNKIKSIDRLFFLHVFYFSVSFSFLFFIIGHNAHGMYAKSAASILLWGAVCFLFMLTIFRTLVHLIESCAFKFSYQFYCGSIAILITINFVFSVAVLQTFSTLFVSGFVFSVCLLVAFLLKANVLGLKFGSVAAAISSLISVGKFGLASATVYLAASPPVPDVSAVKFAKPQNVYLISFDSLVSKEVLTRFFGITDHGHLTAMQSKGYRLLSNTYSSGDSTRPTLNMLLLQSHEFFDESLTVVDGYRKNITYEIFRNNDYKIQFIFSGDEVGVDKGKIDYFFPKSRPFGFCMHAAPGFLFGYCSEALIDFTVRIGLQSPYDEQQDILNARIAAANADKSQPWLTYTYIYFPGHTANRSSWKDAGYMENYKKEHQARLATLGKMITGLTDKIIRQDDDPIIIVFGDHGARLTRGLSTDPGDYPNNSGYSYEDVIKERFGVTIAVYPDDFCRDGLRDNISTLVIARAVIKCLSRGADPLGNQNTNKSYVGDRIVVQDGKVLQ